jgi:hypothetical protein
MNPSEEVRKGNGALDSPGLTDVYEDLISPQFNSIALHAIGRLLRQPAGGDVILPAVPGAGNSIALEFAFTQWASVMKTYAIDCKELTVNMGHGNGNSVHVELADLARRNFVSFRRALKWHSGQLLQYQPGSITMVAGCFNLMEGI